MFEVNRLLLQILKSRAGYEKIRSAVRMHTIDGKIKPIIVTLDNYFAEFPEHAVIVPDTFRTQLMLKNPELSNTDLEFYSKVVDSMMDDPDEQSAKGITRQLKTLEFADALDKANNSYHIGEDVDLFEAVSDLVRRYENDIKRGDRIDYVKNDIAEIIEDDLSGGSTIRWSIDALYGSMPSLGTGMQTIFAARPGRGKTSFCAANAVYMAPQLAEDQPVVWFNNEGKGTRIWNTCYRAALQRSNAEISAMGYSEAESEFIRVTDGKDRVRVFDIHGRDYRFLERIIQNHKPGVVIFDMLDNVGGFADAARTDLRLESLYQWARESAVVYDFLSIPTSQLSVEAEGVAYCNQSMLKDSKTAKQGACDAIVTMGALNKPEYLFSRFLYVPKAFKGTPLNGYRTDCFTEVIFDPNRCTFTEGKGGKQ